MRAAHAPIVVVGGFATPRWALRRLAGALRRAGHPVEVCCVRTGMDCSERSAAQLTARLERVAAAHAAPPVLVAFSRGGQFARVVAVRRPELVRALVTLGTPFRPRLTALSPYMRERIRLLGRLGSLGVPGVVCLDCDTYDGCCRAFWRDLVAPWSPTVPFVSIQAANDRVVRWAEAQDPWAEAVVVDGTHAGLLLRDESIEAALAAVARAVAEPQQACAVCDDEAEGLAA